MGLCPDGDDWYVVMGVDLAVGMDSVNDETAYVIVAYNRETEIRQVLYSWSGKMQAAGSGWLKGQVCHSVGSVFIALAAFVFNRVSLDVKTALV